MAKPIMLLVEDDAEDAELFRAALAKPDELDIVVARDGQEALDRLAAGPPPALVVLDLQLPRVHGLDVLRRLRANPALRAVPVVIFSSSSEPEDRAACAEAGANSYVRKPVDFDQFQRAVALIEAYWLTLHER